MRDPRVLVRYPQGGPHVLLHWEHSYYRRHLMLARSPETLAWAAATYIAKQDKNFHFKYDAYTVEIVAPPAWMELEHAAWARRADLLDFKSGVEHFMRELYNGNGELYPGVALCPDCVRDPGGASCNQEQCSCGLLYPELDYEALYAVKHEEFEKVRPWDHHEEPGLRASRARKARDDEALYAARSEAVRLERTYPGYALTGGVYFYYVNPTPLALPELDAARDAYAEARARQKIENQEREAARDIEFTEGQKQRAKEAREALRRLLG